MLLSFIGFFSSEAWAPRFIFFILLSFLAGSMFPLDILPRPLYILLSLLPFPYLIYGPLKIYLGQQNIFQIFLTLGVGFVWIFILGLFANVMWKKGLSLYGAEGK